MSASYFRSVLFAAAVFVITALHALMPATAPLAEANENKIPLKVIISSDSDLNAARDFKYSYARFAHNYAKNFGIYEDSATVMIGQLTAERLEPQLKELFDPPGQIDRGDKAQAAIIFRIGDASGDMKHDYEEMRKSASAYYENKMLNKYTANFKLSVNYEIRTADGKKVLSSGTVTGSAQAENASIKRPAIYEAADLAAQNAVASIVEALRSSKDLLAYAREEQKRMAANVPGNLRLTAVFSDQSSIIPNDRLDAAEQAELQLVVANEGPGSAVDVRIIGECDSNEIKMTPTPSIGDIMPGQYKAVVVPISADISMASGRYLFKLRAVDKKGSDSEWIRLDVSAMALIRPELEIAFARPREKPGAATNDNDAVIENGESVLIEPQITNNGKGKALQVTVELKNISEGVEIVTVNDSLNTIDRGESKTGRLAVAIPASYSHPEITYTVRATDIRGLVAEKTFTAPIVINKPELTASVELINSAKADTIFLGSKVTCRVKVTNTGRFDAKDVGVRLKLDGKSLSYDRKMDIGLLKSGQSKSKDFALNIDTATPVGKMDILADVLQSDQATASKKITCTLAEKPVPKSELLGGANKIALVVGVGQFKDKRHARLQYAAGDADKYYRFLLSDEGGAVPKENAALLTDQSAALSNIKSSLQELMARTTSQHSVSIYLATHGLTDESGELYMLCYDSDVSRLGRTAFSENDLVKLLAQYSKSKDIILYLDLCHNGINRWAGDIAKRYVDEYEIHHSVSNIAARLHKGAKANVAGFLASSAPSYSIALDRLGGSVFNWCIIEGLEGEANSNGDQWISPDELDAFLVDKTLAYTMGLQRPRSITEGAGRNIRLNKLQ